MRLASYRHDGGDDFGIVTDDGGLISLGRRLDAVPSLRALLAAGVDLAAPHQRDQPDVATADVVWRPPVTDPTHIIGVGLNTRSHVGERARPAGEEHPRLFLRTIDTVVGHRGEVWKPKASDQFDYEGEIAVVIGRAGRHIPRPQAVSYIAGYACFDDGSVRDFQRHTTQNTAGKNFANSGGFGPWLTTADDAPPWTELGSTTTVNREVRQTLHPGDHIFGFDELISYVSEIWTLQPGDVIATGSPSGSASATGGWLKAGDTIEVSVTAVGTLTLTVADEPTV